MLTELHDSLARLVLEHGKIPSEEVDVRFEMPTKQWVDSLVRPTINFFLFDIQENTELRHTNVQSTRANGRAIYRMPPRRFDLRYMVSAPSTVAADEYLLLWRVLGTLLRNPTLPPDLLSEQLRTLEPAPTMQVMKTDDGPDLLDVWSALELPPRPALLYVVTTPIDLEISFESPLVLTRTTRYTRPNPEDEARGLGIQPGYTPRTAVTVSLDTEIGGVVLDKRGAPIAGVRIEIDGRSAEPVTTAQDGTFILGGIEPGEIALRLTAEGGKTKRVKLTVPSESYTIVME